MDWKAKAVDLLTKLTENKYLRKAETKIVGYLDSISPKEVVEEIPTEEGGTQKVENI